MNVTCSERVTLARLSAYHRATLRVPAGSIYPTGTRFHIPDFSLISGSLGDKASTRSRGPVTRVTCHGNQDSLRLVLARAVACLSVLAGSRLPGTKQQCAGKGGK